MMKHECPGSFITLKLHLRNAGPSVGSEQRHTVLFSLSYLLLLQIGPARFRAPELLFRPDLIGEECEGLHEVLVFAIQKSDMDLRRTLFSNIVLSGGSTLFKGSCLSSFSLLWYTWSLASFSCETGRITQSTQLVFWGEGCVNSALSGYLLPNFLSPSHILLGMQDTCLHTLLSGLGEFLLFFSNQCLWKEWIVVFTPAAVSHNVWD